MAEKETWRNVSRGDRYVRVYDARFGDKCVNLKPGQSINLTAEERIMNSDAAFDEKGDVFKNGSLVPVRLLDSVEDYQEIASNPNHLAESDLEALFKLPARQFKARIAEISNVTALDRMAELAKEEQVSATVSQVKALDDRLSELVPKLSDRKPMDALKEVSPR